MIVEEIVDVPYCYECGSLDVWVMADGDGNRYRCDNCGHEWQIHPTGNVAEPY